MRSLILAGVTIAALGLGSVAVQAGPVWQAKHTLKECLWSNVIGNVKQFNCATNVVSDEGYWGNNGNKQKIEQKNKAIVEYAPDGPFQINLGANVVVEGDHNKQKIEQSNFYKDNNEYGEYEGPVQSNYGLNVVEDGSHNSQSIDQSNTMIVGGHSD